MLPVKFLIEIGDSLTQKSLRRVVLGLDQLVADPRSYLTGHEVVIGPKRRFMSRLAVAFVVGGVTFVMIGLILVPLYLVLGIDEDRANVVTWPVCGCAVIGSIWAVFYKMRGGSCVLRDTGAEFRFHGQVIFCPWALFSATGRTVVQPEGTSFTVPISPAAMDSILQKSETEDDFKPAVTLSGAQHVKLQGGCEAVLLSVYEVAPEEMGDLLLQLGARLGSSAASQVQRQVQNPTQSQIIIPLATKRVDGSITMRLARLFFPTGICCGCVHPTEETATLESGGLSGKRFRTSIPLCVACKAWENANIRRAFLKGAVIGFIGPLVVLAILSPALRAPDFALLFVFAVLPGPVFGGLLARDFLATKLVRFDYLPAQGIARLRFHNQEYANYLLTTAVEEGHAKRE